MTDKTLFITGASSGIGEATARLAVEKGWNVGLFARSKDKLEALAGDLGDKALALPGDATSLDAQAEAMKKLNDRFGSLDAAFANAGTGLDTPGTRDGDPQEWEAMIRLNILGLMWTTKAASAYFEESGGHLVLTGSQAGRVHIKGSLYGATKWFVHGYAGNLAQEFRDWGARVTVIAPGMVDTAFFAEPKPDKLKPEDIAQAVLFALEADKRAMVQEIFVTPTG